MMNLIEFLMMAPQGGAGGDKGSGMGGSTLIFLVLIIVVFYFFMIRPQSKKNKELKKFREGLNKGQKIVTIGGVHGKILEVSENTVIIETEGQGKLKIEKSAISQEFNQQDAQAQTGRK